MQEQGRGQEEGGGVGEWGSGGVGEWGRQEFPPCVLLTRTIEHKKDALFDYFRLLKMVYWSNQPLCGVECRTHASGVRFLRRIEAAVSHFCIVPCIQAGRRNFLLLMGCLLHFATSEGPSKHPYCIGHVAVRGEAYCVDLTGRLQLELGVRFHFSVFPGPAW